MRNWKLAAIALLWLLDSQALAQTKKETHPENSFMTTRWMTDSANVFGANLGLTVIDDQTFVGFRLRPEIAIGKVGIGLDVPLLFSLNTGEMRLEEYRQGIGWLRLVRYFRFGRKERDPFFVKVGDISGTYLGYGLLVNNYSNAVSFERRKVGATFDVIFDKKWGLEAFYSDFDLRSFNLLGVRPYVRPLGRSKIPILKTLEFGATYVSDYDRTVGATYVKDVETPTIERSGQARRYQHTGAGVTAFGADVGITLINTSFLQLVGYAQYARLNRVGSDSLDRYIAANPDLDINYHAGQGINIGAAAKLHLIADLLNIEARLERVWYSENFIPQFFDVLYEVDKDARILSLLTVDNLAGTFGSLRGHILDRITVGGSLLMPDNIGQNQPGMLQLVASVDNVAEKINVIGIYIKSGLTSLGDAFNIDEQSLARLRFTYNFHKFFHAGLEYHWTFARLDNGQFEATNHMMPFVGLRIPLNIGNAPGTTN